jgi:hypothetical protein
MPSHSLTTPSMAHPEQLPVLQAPFIVSTLFRWTICLLYHTLLRPFFIRVHKQHCVKIGYSAMLFMLATVLDCVAWPGCEGRGYKDVYWKLLKNREFWPFRSLGHKIFQWHIYRIHPHFKATCDCIYNCYIFLLNCPFHHYIMTLFLEIFLR